MRALLALTLGILLLMPACQATQPIIPKVTVQLSPSVQNVTVTSNQKGSAQFTGTVTVEKPPVVRMSVSLVSSVDAGWQSSCSPSSIVVTDTSPHTFSVSVVVPENTPSVTGTLSVMANAVGMGFSVTDTATATIRVTGSSVSNLTAQNKTSQAQGTSAGTLQNSTSPSTAKPGRVDYMTISAVSILLVAVGGGVGYFVIRRRKRRMQEAG